MLTDYKVNGEPVGISQCVGSGGYKVTSSVFKQNGEFITGDKYLPFKGQRRVLPDSIAYKNDTDTGFAAYGTACYGGTPDFERSSGKGENETDYYYFFFNGTQLSYTYRYDYVTKNILRTYHSAPFLKIWVAACGSGGGGANNEGAGGGGGGFAILPIILEPDHPIRIYIGPGGFGGFFEDSNTYHSGSNGTDTTISVLEDEGYKTVAIMKGGTGGYDGDRTELKYAPGGNVYLFGKGGTYLPTRWLGYLSASKDDLECEAYATTNNSCPSQVNTTLCTTSAGASGGGGHKGAGVNGGQCFISGRTIDYSYCFGIINWYTTAGEENKATADHSSGGGASAYYGSSGGNGGDHSNGNSGTYGGGGGSGDCETILFSTTAYAGGHGGQGCFSMWFPHA